MSDLGTDKSEIYILRLHKRGSGSDTSSRFLLKLFADDLRHSTSFYVTFSGDFVLFVVVVVFLWKGGLGVPLLQGIVPLH